MVASGYAVERGIFLALFSVHTVLFVQQSLTEFLSPKREAVGTIKWSSHRFGTLTAILCLLSSIDPSEVFGIYTFSNKADYFMNYYATIFILLLAASAAYSLLRSDAMIVQEKVPLWISYGYTVCLVALFIVANAVLIFTLATQPSGGGQIPRAWFLISGAICLLYFGVCFALASTSLLGRLDAFVTNQTSMSADSTKHLVASLRTLRIFRAVYLVVCFAAIGYLFWDGINAATDPLYPDPDTFHAGNTSSLIFQYISLTISLSFCWNPWSKTAAKPASIPQTPRSPSSPLKGSKGSKGSKGEKQTDVLDAHKKTNIESAGSTSGAEIVIVDAVGPPRDAQVKNPGAEMSTTSAPVFLRPNTQQSVDEEEDRREFSETAADMPVVVRVISK